MLAEVAVAAIDPFATKRQEVWRSCELSLLTKLISSQMSGPLIGALGGGRKKQMDFKTHSILSALVDRKFGEVLSYITKFLTLIIAFTACRLTTSTTLSLVAINGHRIKYVLKTILAQ